MSGFASKPGSGLIASAQKKLAALEAEQKRIAEEKTQLQELLERFKEIYGLNDDAEIRADPRLPEDERFVEDLKIFFHGIDGDAKMGEIINFLEQRYPALSRKAIQNKVYRLAMKEEFLKRIEEGVYRLN